MMDLEERIARLSPRQSAVLAELLAGRPDRSPREPIAVVGSGCRLPEGLDTGDGFWSFLLDGGVAVRDRPPEDRLALVRGPAVPAATPPQSYLSGIDQFDAGFFGISPREAEAIDPLHRQLLEVAWEAIEDAGETSLARTGIFIGAGEHEYTTLCRLAARGRGEPDPLHDFHAGIGGASAFASGRIAHALGMEGPCLTVDTACSSSLVAVHLACKALRGHDCETALVGSVNIVLDPAGNRFLQQAGLISPSGGCHAFGGDADGMVRGEGCVVLVLKRLSTALRDQDRIIALIRGSAVGHDGRSAGLTVPRGPAQEQVLLAALADAACEPSTIDYVEAHGTGTTLGDPIEARAIGAVYGRDRDHDRPLLVGSVKANLGHLEAAGGLVGLLKAALAVNRGVVPPQPRFCPPKPPLDWAGASVTVPERAVEWNRDAPRRAAVSSFGFSGTNVHVILEQPPPRIGPRENARMARACLLPLSARDPKALAELARRYAELMDGEDQSGIESICRAAAIRRAHHPHRVAVVATSGGELRARLLSYAAGHPAEGIHETPPDGPAEAARTPATRPGGSPPGLPTNGLTNGPVAAEDATDWGRIADSFVRGEAVDWTVHFPSKPAPVPPVLPLYPWRHRSHWHAALASQGPRSRPALVDSSGDDMDLAESAEKLIARWGGDGTLAMNRQFIAPIGYLAPARDAMFLGDECGSALLALLYVGPEDRFGELAGLLEADAESRGLRFSVIADPRRLGSLTSVGFSATPCGVWQRLADLSRFTLAGRRMRRLRHRVNQFSNSGRCETREFDPDRDGPAVLRLIEEWRLIKGSDPPFLEVVRGEIAGGGLASGRRIFVTSRDGTVECAILLSPAHAHDGYLMDLEFYGRGTGPGALEFSIVEVIHRLREEGHRYLSLGGTFGTGLRPHEHDDPSVRDYLAQVAAAGVLNGDMNAQFKAKFRPEASPLFLARRRGGEADDLPDIVRCLAGSYRPRREVQGGWRLRLLERRPAPREGTGIAPSSRVSDSATVAVRRLTEVPPRGFLWRHPLDDATWQMLCDHTWEGERMAPAAAHLALMAEAAVVGLGWARVVVEDFVAIRPMTIVSPSPRIECHVSQSADEAVDAAVYLGTDVPGASLANWTEHARARMRRLDEVEPASARGFEPDVLAGALGDALSEADFYRSLANPGVRYGPSLRLVCRAWLGDREGLARIARPERDRGQDRNPTATSRALEGALQVFLPLIARSRTLRRPIFLAGIARARFFGHAAEAAWAHVVLDDACGDDAEHGPHPRSFEGSLRLYGESGSLLAEIDGILAREVGVSGDPAPERSPSSCPIDRVVWRREIPRPTVARTAPCGWLILADSGGFGARLATVLRERTESVLLAEPGIHLAVSMEGHATYDPECGDHYGVLLDAVAVNDAGGGPTVVDCRALSASADADSHSTAIERCCRDTLLLLQASEARPSLDRLWFVTSDVVGPSPVGVSATPFCALEGLIRVARRESPGRVRGLVDLDPTVEASRSIVDLLGVIETSSAPCCLAIRGGHRLVPRLQRVRRAAESRRFARGDSTTLITGGLGGLGLVVARWLVGLGARRLVLVGRSAPNPSGRDAIEELERRGCEVVTVRADVGSLEALAVAVEMADTPRRPLRAVYHLAGAVRDGLIAALPWETFRENLRAKAIGAWNLHALTLGRPLDEFVLFGSAACLLAPAGQSGHAAANAYLHGLVRMRRANGLPALAIDWGPWGDVGAATAPKLKAGLSAVGLAPLGNDAGLEALESALRSQEARLAAIPIDWDRWRASMGQDPCPWPIEEDVSDPPAMSPEHGHVRPAVPEARRVDSFAALLERVREIIAQILKLDAVDVDPRAHPRDLGIDSLMCMELRTRLLSDLSLGIPVLDLLRAASVDAIAGRVWEGLEMDRSGRH